MIDLIITSIVVDLSDQKLYAYNGPQLVRTIPVSSGKASTPTPTFSSKVQSKHRSVTMRGRGYVAPGVPWAMCVPGGMICMHGAPWQEAAGQAYGVPAATVACACQRFRPSGCSTAPKPAPPSRFNPERSGRSGHRTISGMPAHRVLWHRQLRRQGALFLERF